MSKLPINKELLSKYEAEIERLNAPATAKRKKSSLRRFLGWAKEKGHVENTPEVLHPRGVPQAQHHLGGVKVLKLSLFGLSAATTVVLAIFLARNLPTDGESPFVALRSLAQKLIPVSQVSVPSSQVVSEPVEEPAPSPSPSPSPEPEPSPSPTPDPGLTTADGLASLAIGGALDIDAVTTRLLNISDGNLEISSVVRFNSFGRLASITGYYQDSGLFEIDQGAPDWASIDKTLTSGTGAATNDVLTLTLDESALTTGSVRDTLVLSRKGAGSGGYALYVKNGDAQFDNNLSIGGQLTLTRNPSRAHTGTWAIGSSTWNASNATIYVNPASPTADSNIFALAKNGDVQFAVDAEGDIYGNNLILVGNTTTGTTTVAGDLSVEGNTTIGDATTDTWTANPATLTWAGGNKTIDLTGAATRTLTLLNSTASQVADLDLGDGSLKTGGTSRLTNAGALQNVTLTWTDLTNYPTGCSAGEAVNAIGDTLTCAAVSSAWSGLSAPTANLSLAHAGYTTAFTFDSVTTADAFALSSTSLTTGTLFDLSSTSTAGGASGSTKLLDLARSGANANSSHTAYGVYSSVTNTGTSSTNVAGYFTASGATTNYGVLVDDGDATFDANVVVGGSTSRTETLANAGFTLGGDDLFVAGTAGIEGNVYTDGSFIAGATTTYADGSVTFSGTTPSIVVGNTGTISVTDGTNTLFSIADGGTTGNATVTGDLRFNGKLLEDGNEILANMIAPFASTCPTGWSEYTSARGRTVVGTPLSGTNAGTQGTALGDLATRTITDVPAHTHSVDPPSTSTSSDGSHSHTFNVGGSGSGSLYGPPDRPSSTTSSAFINSAGAHTHTLDVASFTSGSTGVASVDVTMPYIQLTYCQKTAGADYAEWTVAAEHYEPGTVVSIDPSVPEGIIMSHHEYDPAMVGVVSGAPGWTVGFKGDNTVQLALTGRVPVKVDPASDPIKPGDYLTSSDNPGWARKATKAGRTLGIAMDSWTPDSGNPYVVVFLNLSWHDPDIYLTSTGDLQIEKFAALSEHDSASAKHETVSNFGFRISNLKTGEVINRISVFSEAVVANLRAGRVETQELISPVVETREIRSGGEDLVIDLTNTSEESPQSGASTPTSEVTGTGSSDGESGFGKLIVKGDVEISGDATVSGTLRADRIEANEIVGVDLAFERATQANQDVVNRIKERLASLETTVNENDIAELLEETATSSASLTFSASTWEAEGDKSNWTNRSNLSNLDLTGGLNVLGNTNIYGSTTLADTYITGTLNVVGDAATSLLALSSDQFSLFGGKFIVDAGGDVLVQGNLTVSGTLKAQKSEFGELLADSATFQEVTVGKFVIAAPTTPEESSSATSGVTTTNATAGKAVLPKGQTELLISNSLISNNSLIYVVPEGSTNNTVLYVASKEEGQSFTIAVDRPIPYDAPFSWWIIELR